MADEPELKTATRQRSISPLMAAWAIVILLLVITVAWITFSEEPVTTADPTSAADQDVSSGDMPTTSAALDIREEPEQPVSDENQPAGINNNNFSDNPETISTIPEQINTQPAGSLSSTQTPLKPAPNQNLLVRGENGFKPALGPDGLIAWQEYARPYTRDDNNIPKIALMVTDIGLNSRSSNTAIDNLPGQVDLAYSPYGRNLQDWMDRGRAKGHEGFLMIPTEPVNYPANDPGPHTLITDLNPRDNLLRLDWVLSQVAGYVGVINHMGSKFTTSEEALTPILSDLQSRGLMLVDARSSRYSIAARIARTLNMPRAINDRYIDNVITAAEIQSQLRELEITANTFGVALGLARATPLTIDQIALWAETLSNKGIELVPVTAIANRQPIR
jgi:polysaccharide deacetylase 2 family uncharacterized protein YibQ